MNLKKLCGLFLYFQLNTISTDGNPSKECEKLMWNYCETVNFSLNKITLFSQFLVQECAVIPKWMMNAMKPFSPDRIWNERVITFGLMLPKYCQKSLRSNSCFIFKSKFWRLLSPVNQYSKFGFFNPKVTTTLVSNMGLKGEYANEGRIIGGKDVPSPIPWQIHLKQEFWNKKVKSLCGGTIIGKKTILTAAHCFQRNDIKNDKFFIAAGTIDFKDNVKFQIQILIIQSWS